MADQPHWMGVKACTLATPGDSGIALFLGDGHVHENERLDFGAAQIGRWDFYRRRYRRDDLFRSAGLRSPRSLGLQRRYAPSAGSGNRSDANDSVAGNSTSRSLVRAPPDRHKFSQVRRRERNDNCGKQRRPVNAGRFFVELTTGPISWSTAWSLEPSDNLGCILFEKEAYCAGTFRRHSRRTHMLRTQCMAQE